MCEIFFLICTQTKVTVTVECVCVCLCVKSRKHELTNLRSTLCIYFYWRYSTFAISLINWSIFVSLFCIYLYRYICITFVELFVNQSKFLTGTGHFLSKKYVILCGGVFVCVASNFSSVSSFQCFLLSHLSIFALPNEKV